VKFQTAGTGIAGALCDLTSAQVLVADNGQLATLDAATGKQLSYRGDPYQSDDNPDPACPSIVGTGLTGVGLGLADGDVEQIQFGQVFRHGWGFCCAGGLCQKAHTFWRASWHSTTVAARD
jgi:hypothetical protein